MKQNKTTRLSVNMTSFELKLLKALIQDYYNENGVELSRSQYILMCLAPSFKDAQDYLVKEEH